MSLLGNFFQPRPVEFEFWFCHCKNQNPRKLHDWIQQVNYSTSRIQGISVVWYQQHTSPTNFQVIDFFLHLKHSKNSFSIFLYLIQRILNLLLNPLPYSIFCAFCSKGPENWWFVHIFNVCSVPLWVHACVLETRWITVSEWGMVVVLPTSFRNNKPPLQQIQE